MTFTYSKALLSIACTTFVLFPVNAKIHYTCLYTSVLQGVPFLDLHHVVILSVPHSDKCVAIDFSPLNQRSSTTILSLVKNEWVPAEIRARWIRKSDNISMKNEWSCFNLPSCAPSPSMAGDGDIVSKQYSQRGDLDLQEHPKDADPEIERAVIEICNSWESRMNFYTHNCQHFSRYVNHFVNKRYSSRIAS